MRKLSRLSRLLLLFAVLISVFSAMQIRVQASTAAWAPNTAYTVGALVTYGGSTYKCIHAHTSQVGWEPPNVPALWQLQAGGPTATNTFVRPPTNTTSVGQTPLATATSIR